MMNHAGEHCSGEHQGACSVDKTLLALSTNLRTSLQGTSRWSLSDTTAGLFKVYNLHALTGATDTLIHGAEVHDRYIESSHSPFFSCECASTKSTLNLVAETSWKRCWNGCAGLMLRTWMTNKLL